MNAAVAALASLSVAAYAWTIVRLLRGAQIGAGSRPLNVIAVLLFCMQRLLPQSALVAAVASIGCIVALLAVTRRSTLHGGVLAAVPLLVMLLVIVRPFLGAASEDFQRAVIALLCAAGPAALLLAVISPLRQS